MQHQDKTSEDVDFIHAATKAHDAPLLINDHIDVTLTIGPERVHIGRDNNDVHLKSKNSTFPLYSSPDIRFVC